MIHMVGLYLTVNMFIFTVLHSIFSIALKNNSTHSIALRNPSLFTNNKRLLRYLTVMTVSRAYHNEYVLEI